jgi:hypothetical protein
VPVGRNFLVVTYGYSQGEVGVDSYRDRYNVTNRTFKRLTQEVGPTSNIAGGGD